MTTQYTINVDWDAIHAACKEVDQHRRSHCAHLSYTPAFGSSGCTDAFGGSYFPHWFESHGVLGLRWIVDAFYRILDDTYKALSEGRRAYEQAATITHEDYYQAWESRCPNRPNMTHNSHRGAAYRASRYNGTCHRVPVTLNRDALNKRTDKVLTKVKAAVETAKALNKLRALLVNTGMVDGRANEILLISQDRAQLAGVDISWIPSGQSV